MRQVMHIHAQIPSLSARRAWIEIKVRYPWTPLTSSLSARRAWIEIWAWGRRGPGAGWSLSARRAWIEISEGADLDGPGLGVALRKESVDRNQDGRNSQNIERRSLSARRAWIEISRARI